ncbi:probable mediator of RNA polymerase II transcription subunit 26b [Oryza brachyantha]|uniref:probable mediator of RNA polymerase II transcription subunit 26b n=1 Tax=Oryza brachyantha TaxID=4533 RepID=UPI001ADC226A|nr:probable mediator of RNA polymerase II transcription subunit 26b [Oryza brachyantha]
MAPPPPSLDYWRGFFGGARAGIFDAIEAAIRVAAEDHPDALRARRDGIAERLYTALVVLPSTPRPLAVAEVAARPDQQLPPGAVPTLCSSDRAEVITDDDDGAAAAAADARGDCNDDRVAAEAFRVKAALFDAQDKTEAELLDLLRALQKLEFTVDTIRVTEIGTAVKPLRKHGSKQIRQLVRSLIDGWKIVVNDWVNNGGAIVDHTPQSMDGSCLEQEGGLPSPPMDEAALFATPCTSIQLSEFFDEMDDDGNIRTGAKESVQQHYPANQEPSKKQRPMGQGYDPEENWKLDQSAMRQSQPYEPSNWQTKQQSITGTQRKHSAAAHGPWTPQKMHFEPKCSEMRTKQQQDAPVAQRPKPTMRNELSSQVDQNSVQVNAKLEATKRMLQEGYQEFYNAKKQRTIQVVDPQDLPKQRNRNVHPSCKPRNNSNNNSLRNRHAIRR